MLFGKSKKVVGIDIGSRYVKAVELTRTGSEFAISGFGMSEIRDGDPRQTVTEVLQVANIKARLAVSAISGRQAIIRYVTMMQMSNDDLRNAIRFEADKYIPFEIDEVQLDCQRLDGDDAGEKQMRVLLVAVKRSLIAEHVAFIKGCGLIPMVIDHDSFALGNAFEIRGNLAGQLIESTRSAALIDIGAQKTSINVVRNNSSYFSREIYIGGNEFTDAIAKRLDLDAAEAERVKLSPMERSAEVLEAAATAIEDLSNELLLSFDYYENQFDRPVDEVFVSGGGSQIAGIEEMLGRIFDRPVKRWNPTDGIKVDTGLVDEARYRASASQLAVTVGLVSRVNDVT